MKNKSEHITLEKNSTNNSKKHIEHKYLNRNSTSANISIEINNNLFNKFEDIEYQTIEKDSEKNNKTINNSNNNFNFSQGKYYPIHKKDFFQRNGEYKKIYLPKEFKSYQEYKNNINKGLKPFNLYSQSIENKHNKTNIQNNSNNYIEENIYPSNYSYYEYKYLKKKIVPKKDNNFNNNIQITSKYGKDCHNNNYSNVALKTNQNLKKIQIINNNKNISFINIPSEKKKSEVYYKIKKDKINSSANSSYDYKKKNLILKNTLNISNIKSYNQYNNTFIQSTIQPRTPSLFIKSKIYSPIKSLVGENIKKNVDNLRNKKQGKKNLSSKSSEKISIKKLEFIQPKNKNIIFYKKKINLSNNNKYNINELSNRFGTETSKYSPRVIKNVEKVYTIFDNKEKYNNNITITINDTNRKKNISKNTYKIINKNLNLNIESKQKIQEHLKCCSEFLPSNQGKYIVKDVNNITEKKNNNIFTVKNIKIIDSNKLKNLALVNNNITKITVYKNKETEKDKKDNIKIHISNNIRKNNKEEKKYMREIKNIMYDNYTDPTQLKYTFKDNMNSIEKKDNKNINIITKRRIGTNQAIIESNNYQQNIESKKKINEKNKLSHDINNNKISINTNINAFEHNKKLKSKDIILSHTDIKKNDQTINKNSNVNGGKNRELKINNVNNVNKKAINNNNFKNKAINNSNINNGNNKEINNITNGNNKIINSNNINNINNKEINNINVNKLEKEKKNHNIFFNLKNLDHSDKYKKPITPKNDSILSKKTMSEKNKNKAPKSKLHRNLSEIPKHSSRVDEISRKEEKNLTKIDDWDKIHFKGMRKRTYDAGRGPRKKNKNSKKNKKNSLKELFSSTVFIKATEGFTQAGEIEKGKRKRNQDTYIIEKNINGVLNFNIFGVFDGHGDDGHLASQFVKRYIINRIKNHPLIKKLDEPQEIYTQLKEKGFEIITNIFIDADSQIQKEKFDFTRSGTTVVLIIQLEEHIICANTGDSRAIAVYDENNEDNLANSKIFHLSYDCKPELPNEKRRIYECGGEVDKAYYSDDEKVDDSITPFRVFAKGEDYPGLAMSRSIGDMDAKKVGVIPNPQFVEYTIDYYSKYLLICSDGIWEFMSNEEAMKISNKFYLRNDPNGLCHELYQSSVKLWDNRDILIDDITIVVAFF